MVVPENTNIDKCLQWQFLKKNHDIHKSLQWQCEKKHRYWSVSPIVVHAKTIIFLSKSYGIQVTDIGKFKS